MWFYGHLVMRWIGLLIPVRTEGLDKLLNCRPAVLVMNHLSAFDVFTLGLLPLHNVNITLRSWPFRLFWFYPYMKLAQYLDVERGGWQELLAAGKREKARGEFILVYPEAHRSRNGRLQRFHIGPFQLAIELDLPVLALCIQGTEGFLPPGSLRFRRAKLKLACLDPITLTEEERREAVKDMRRLLRDRVKRAMIQYLEGKRDVGMDEKMKVQE